MAPNPRNARRSRRRPGGGFAPRGGRHVRIHDRHDASADLDDLDRASSVGRSDPFVERLSGFRAAMVLARRASRDKTSNWPASAGLLRTADVIAGALVYG